MGCPCGYPRKRSLTRAQVNDLSKLRGYRIKVCVFCGHEVESPKTAKDVRKLAAAGQWMVHAACRSMRLGRSA